MILFCLVLSWSSFTTEVLPENDLHLLLLDASFFLGTLINLLNLTLLLVCRASDLFLYDLILLLESVLLSLIYLPM